MKTKYLFLTFLILLAGCSLIWSPTATVKKFVAASQKGDVDTMTKLFSSKAIQNLGAATIRSNNQSFADMAKRATATGGTYRMENIQESSLPDGKQVSFFYKNDKSSESIKLVFLLSKEDGAWKIDNIGGPESPQLNADLPAATVPMIQQEQPTPPAATEKPQTRETSTTPKTISGGVLNGKAISLPKPLYPLVAKSAKASGTVVVQVTVDENGNVVSAHAVSGHPLLQAASIAAAHQAKFSPTKLSGQPVKVSGIITYNFVAE